jgi:type I restriction enzyme S subunit
MELKEGYKQTDVGVIPEDWGTIELGQLLEFKNGLNKSKEYFGSGTTIINYLDVYKYPHLDATHVTGLVKVEKSEQLRYGVKDGDVLFTRTSETVDEIGMSAVVYNPPEGCVFSGFVLRGRFLGSKNQVSRQFLGWLLRSSSVRSQIADKASYTTRALTNGKLLGKVIIQIPSFGEQEAIAEVLSDVDAEIESLARRLEKLLNQKQGLSEELLSGRKRLVEPKSIGFKQTDVGVIPEDWQVSCMDGLVDFKNGRPNEANLSELGSVNLITLDSVDISGQLKSRHKRISKGDGSLKPGDLVTVLSTVVSDLNHGNLLGMTDAIPADGEEYALNQRMGRLRTISDGLESRWLRLQLNAARRHFAERAQGTSQKHVYARDFYQLTIPLPSLNEQRAIAEVLSDVDAEIQAVAKLKAKVQAKKEGLMQTLLTGKIRLT